MWIQKIKTPLIESFHLLPTITSNFCKNLHKNKNIIVFNYKEDNNLIKAFTNFEYINQPLQNYKGINTSMNLVGYLNKRIKLNVTETIEYYEMFKNGDKWLNYNLSIGDESIDLRIKLYDEMTSNLFLYMNDDRFLELESIRKIIERSGDKYIYIHRY